MQLFIIVVRARVFGSGCHWATFLQTTAGLINLTVMSRKKNKRFTYLET